MKLILEKDPPSVEITIQLEALSLSLNTSYTSSVSLWNIKGWKTDWDTVKYVLRWEPDRERHVLNNYLINSTVLLVIVMPMTLQPKLSQIMIYAAEKTAVITAPVPSSFLLCWWGLNISKKIFQRLFRRLTSPIPQLFISSALRFSARFVIRVPSVNIIYWEFV